MQLTDTTTYTTTILTFEDEKDEYIVTHSESFMEPFTSEWNIKTIDDEDVDVEKERLLKTLSLIILKKS